MSAWRQAGLTYINFSTIAAKVLRKSLKLEVRVDAAKRDVTAIRFTKWENGAPVKQTSERAL